MAAMICTPDEGGTKEAAEAMQMMREMWGTNQIDQFVRSAVSSCWTMLPKKKRTFARLKVEINRLVQRALKDFKDDAEAFEVNLTGKG